ncbi:MAG TPA: type II secretion system protein [Bryobacteraceae bacterium]|nr:type II secretion system protein [Bryobacteraceae bacterium]
MRQRGFTVLEMIVATTIMGIAVVGLLSAISNSTRNAARLNEYSRVVQLARLRMNELLADPRLPRDILLSGPYDPALSGGLQAGWQARLTAFEAPPTAAPGQMSLDRIQLEVWWMAGSQRRTFTLDGFRPRVMTGEDFVPGVAR